jgi:Protein of unknown function (DUF2752)
VHARRFWHAETVTEQSWSASGDAPEQRQQPRHLHNYVLAGSGLVLAGTLAYIAIEDPHRAGSVYPVCAFKLMTGWNCPFCGGLRMTHDLLHFDLPAAVSDNVFALVGIPLLIAWVLLRRHFGRPALTVWTLVAVVALSTVWTVLRNLQGFPLVPTVSG